MKTFVLGLVCPSFMGSTILELLLNTHPQIASIGEVYRVIGDAEHGKLLDRGLTPRCRFCGDGCPVFPASDIPLRLENVHRRVTAALDVPWIVDSSKVSVHFEMAEAMPTANAYGYVVLVKRPGPSLGSFLKHGIASTAEVCADVWCRWYENLPGFLRGRRYMVLPYDEMTEDVGLALTRVTAFMNSIAADDGGPRLRYEYDVGGYLEHPAHRFFGNTATATGKSRPVLPDETWREHYAGPAPRAIYRMWETYYEILGWRKQGFRWA